MVARRRATRPAMYVFLFTADRPFDGQTMIAEFANSRTYGVVKRKKKEFDDDETVIAADRNSVRFSAVLIGPYFWRWLQAHDLMKILGSVGDE